MIVTIKKHTQVDRIKSKARNRFLGSTLKNQISNLLFFSSTEILLNITSKNRFNLSYGNYNQLTSINKIIKPNLPFQEPKIWK
uniref:Putative ovule protein n=1 Tax=Solanum chacoense TaxID=4108 RepID=A0A0V0IIZ3_SOLCH